MSQIVFGNLTRKIVAASSRRISMCCTAAATNRYPLNNIQRQQQQNLVFLYIGSKSYLVNARNYATDNKKQQEDLKKEHVIKPVILSKLFPQTAVDVDAATMSERLRQEQEEAKHKEKSQKRAQFWLKVGVCSVAALVSILVYDFGSAGREENGKIKTDQFSSLPQPKQFLLRLIENVRISKEMLERPSSQKLLPDPEDEPYQPLYTLVLEMNDVLIHPEWTYNTGWRFKKRPGVDIFLQEAFKNFEIVLFTADQGVFAYPILDQLDPKGYIKFRLVRDATHVIHGHHVKNLEHLNRDLKKVIVIDWDRKSTMLHPRNAFNITRWQGNDDDIEILELLSFLTLLATSQVDDVRNVLEYYQKFPDPLKKFRENCAKSMELEEEQEKKKSKNELVKRFAPSFFGARA